MVTEKEQAVQLGHCFESIRELRKTVELLVYRVDQLEQVVSLMQGPVQADGQTKEEDRQIPHGFRLG